MEATKCERLTHVWAGTTLDAFCFMAKGQSEAAARTWVEACDLLGEHPHGDAVAAVALSNAAVGNVLLHRSAAARAAFLASEDCWRAVAATIETRELPVATTSSSFHFRLAARDTESFTRLRRKRYVQLCQAGREIARFNSLQAGLNLSTAVLADRIRDLRTCLTQAFGASCAEMALLSERDEDSGIARASLHEAKTKTFNRIVEAAKPPLDFWTRLDCAVRLAALLAPPCAGHSISQAAHRR
ncbi:hypothetical protein [Hyphomicrobium sp.]|uniref:hypothetical protein n=1 Tax=Hyphomicrobium sp. TaxID=82 RepID=UPI003F6F7BE0